MLNVGGKLKGEYCVNTRWLGYAFANNRLDFRLHALEQSRIGVQRRCEVHSDADVLRADYSSKNKVPQSPVLWG